MSRWLILLYLLSPLELDPPAPSPERWAALREWSVVFELTDADDRRWSSCLDTEIRWHRYYLRETADCPPLSFAAGLPPVDVCEASIAFAEAVLDSYRNQAALSPGNAAAWSHVVEDQEARVHVWNVMRNAQDRNHYACTRRGALRRWMELTGGSWPAPANVGAFRRIDQ